jgi:NDP-sugar pyrophosphorylase family protein
MNFELRETPAVVLAGGFGTRIQHLLPGVPKPMAPVNGRPFLEWIVRYLAKQGIRKVVISTGHLAEVVEKHFQKNPVKDVSTLCVPETSPLGTAGGFLNAVRASGEKPEAWIVLNGDSLAFANLSAAAAMLERRAARPAGPFPPSGELQTGLVGRGGDGKAGETHGPTLAAGVVIGKPLADASRYGTLAANAAGDLLRFEEKKPGSGVINTGIYLLRHSLVEQFPDRAPLSLEKDVFPALTARKALLKVLVMDAPFLDIGTPESLPEADKFIRENFDQFA